MKNTKMFRRVGCGLAAMLIALLGCEAVDDRLEPPPGLIAEAQVARAQLSEAVCTQDEEPSWDDNFCGFYIGWGLPALDASECIANTEAVHQAAIRSCRFASEILSPYDDMTLCQMEDEFGACPDGDCQLYDAWVLSATPRLHPDLSSPHDWLCDIEMECWCRCPDCVDH